LKRIEHAIPTPGIVRAGWYLLVELAERPRSTREIVELASQLYPFAAGRLPWEAALQLLVATGFTSRQNDSLYVNRRVGRGHSPVDLLTGVLLTRPPAWLLMAEVVEDALRLRKPYGSIPGDDAATLQDWGLLDSDCCSVPASARSFWSQLLASIQAPGLTDRAPDNDGVDGEEAVVASETQRLIALGRPDLAEDVSRVSVISDGYGYDVRSYFGIEGEDWAADDPLHIEVKSTTATIRKVSEFRLYLTRHEFEVSRRDPSWVLACWAPQTGWPVYVARASLVPCVPEDVARGRWQVALMRVALGGAMPAPTDAIACSNRYAAEARLRGDHG
jgi:hypothetical protein